MTFAEQLDALIACKRTLVQYCCEHGIGVLQEIDFKEKTIELLTDDCAFSISLLPDKNSFLIEQSYYLRDISPYICSTENPQEAISLVEAWIKDPPLKLQSGKWHCKPKIVDQWRKLNNL